MEGSQEQTPFTSVPPETDSAPLKHSGPGIASFVIGLLSILLAVVAYAVIFVGLAEYADEGVLAMPGPEELAGNMSLVGGTLLFFFSLLLAVVGAVLGIVGCVIRNRRRVFAVLGLVFNALLIVGTIALFVISLALGQLS